MPLPNEIPAGEYATLGDECAAICEFGFSDETHPPELKTAMRPMLAFCFYAGALALWSHLARAKTKEAGAQLRRDMILGAHEAGLIEREDLPAELLPLADAKRSANPN